MFGLKIDLIVSSSLGISSDLPLAALFYGSISAVLFLSFPRIRQWHSWSQPNWPYINFFISYFLLLYFFSMFILFTLSCFPIFLPPWPNFFHCLPYSYLPSFSLMVFFPPILFLAHLLAPSAHHGWLFNKIMNIHQSSQGRNVCRITLDLQCSQA